MNSYRFIGMFVIDKAQLLKPLHEKTNPPIGWYPPFLRSFPDQVGNHGLCRTYPIKIGEGQKLRSLFSLGIAAIVIKSCWYRMFLFRTYAHSMFDRLTSRAKACIIVFLSIRRSVHSVIVQADPVRSCSPAMQSLPTKSWSLNMSRTASFF